MIPLTSPQVFMLAVFGLAAGGEQVKAGMEMSTHRPLRGFMIWWGGYTLLESMITLAQVSRLQYRPT